MIWKGYRRKRFWANLRFYPEKFPVNLRKTTKNFSQGSQWLSKDLNWLPPKTCQ